MAIIYQGVLGPFHGRLGTAVGYVWKGKACVRSYRKEIHYPNTPLQQEQRNWFVSMVRFASKATDALKLGLRQRAAEAQMTEGNYFVRQNKQWFKKGGNELEVDFSRLQLAEGAAADVYFKAPQFDADEVLTVEFEKNSLSLHASGNDRVYLYVYAPSLQTGLLSAPAERRSKRLMMRLPEEWTGQEVHVYGFVVDREGRASRSTYIGVGCVDHYEDRGRYIPLNKNWNDFVEIAHTAESAREEEPMQSAQTEKKHVDLFANMGKQSPPE